MALWISLLDGSQLKAKGGFHELEATFIIVLCVLECSTFISTFSILSFSLTQVLYNG